MRLYFYLLGITVKDSLESRINDWKCHWFEQTRQQRHSTNTTSLCAVWTASVHVPLIVCWVRRHHSRCSFVFSSIFLSDWPMSFDVMLKWRLVSGLRSCHASRQAPDPCFRWSMNLFPLAQDPLDRFCLDVCVYGSDHCAPDTLSLCQRVFNEWTVRFFILLRDCTVSDLHCGKQPETDVKARSWSTCSPSLDPADGCCDHVSMHMILALPWPKPQ